MESMDGGEDDWSLATRLLGRPARVVGRLTGGEHAVTTIVTDGVDEYVLRRFPPGDKAVTNEVEVLARLTGLGDLVPSLIDYDERGAEPSILTRKLAGSHPPPDLSPHAMATQLGAVLAEIHAMNGTGLRSAPEVPPDGDSEIARRARQEWAGLDRAGPVLTHWDYWCGNTLWIGTAISGVVDWSGARDGPRGIDLAWCRQDLMLLGDPDAADVMLAAYRAVSGQSVDDIAAWDRQAAAQADPSVEEWSANYTGIGRDDLTGSVLRHRLDAWIDDLLRSQ